MNPATIMIWVCLWMFSAIAYAGNFGNTGAQEIGDVVLRPLDTPLNYVNSHVGIYVGQTNKYGDIPLDRINHTVIQMTGILPGGWTFLPESADPTGKEDPSYQVIVTQVAHVEFVNFDEFARSHPGYDGAYTQDVDVTLEERKVSWNVHNC